MLQFALEPLLCAEPGSGRAAGESYPALRKLFKLIRTTEDAAVEVRCNMCVAQSVCCGFSQVAVKLILSLRGGFDMVLLMCWVQGYEERG